MESETTVQVEATKFVINAEGVVGFRSVLSVGNLQPESVVISCGDTWAIKITKDGIISNPDVPTDEGAKAMFDALEPYIQNLSK